MSSRRAKVLKKMLIRVLRKKKIEFSMREYRKLKAWYSALPWTTKSDFSIL